MRRRILGLWFTRCAACGTRWHRPRLHEWQAYLDITEHRQRSHTAMRGVAR